MFRVQWINHLIVFKPGHTSLKGNVSCNCMFPVLSVSAAWVSSVPLCVSWWHSQELAWVFTWAVQEQTQANPCAPSPSISSGKGGWYHEFCVKGWNLSNIPSVVVLSGGGGIFQRQSLAGRSIPEVFLSWRLCGSPSLPCSSFLLVSQLCGEQFYATPSFLPWCIASLRIKARKAIYQTV